MDIRTLERSLTSHAGGALVTIQDIADWSGRSREYLRQRVLPELEYHGDGTSKFYFAGDVARAIVEGTRRS